LNYFLGFQVKQLKDGTFISQMKYTQDLLKRFGMKDAKPAKTPMGTDGHVDLNKGGVGPMLRRRRSYRKKRSSAEAVCIRWPKVPLREASVLQTDLKIE
jgi:hypothetical protein